MGGLLYCFNESRTKEDACPDAGPFNVIQLPHFIRWRTDRAYKNTVSTRNLKEYYEIVNEARSLSGFLYQDFSNHETKQASKFHSSVIQALIASQSTFDFFWIFFLDFLKSHFTQVL